MKIRSGFVSNSSSSSFCIYGFCDPDTEHFKDALKSLLDMDDLKVEWEKMNKDRHERLKDYDWYKPETFDEWWEHLLDDGLSEAVYSLGFYEKNPVSHLEFHQSDFATWVGLSLTDMPRNVVVGEWMDEAAKALKHLFGEDKEPSIILDSYYN